ncbi:MAG: hypothetical protein JO079_07390 [Frankiaceae bacterium]|nr:hypothetical protein [Frankiaceae bacterium]MBV9368791.1 hypothetical protein [Frankiales bacterium]
MTEMRPTFFSSPDGVRDVMRRARARKRRRALLTSGGFAVVAAVTGVLIGAAGTGTGADRLGVVPTAPDHHGARPAPGSTASPAAHSQPTSPSSVGAAGSGPALPGASGTTTPGKAISGPRRSSSPAPTAPVKRHSANAPIKRTTVAYNSACDPTYDVQAWCEIYTGPTQARRKHTVTLSMELCRPSVVGDGTITFTDTRQVLLELDDGSGTEVWRAGQGLAYKNTTSSVVVRAGTCLRWTSSWDTISADGFYAPPGSYTVTFGVDSNDVTSTTTGNTLTLTD